MIAANKSRQECGERVHIEVEQRTRDDNQTHGWNLQNGPIRRPLVCPPCHWGAFRRPAWRVRHTQGERGNEQSGNAGHVKCHSPAEPRSDKPAHKSTKEISEGKTEHEERKRAGALRRWIQIADQGVAGGSAGSFSYAHAEARSEHRAIVPGQPGSSREEAPGRHSPAQQFGAVPSIG